jgi:O-antigen/teichoic acid export membrane protein
LAAWAWQSLQQPAMRASAFTFGSYGASQFLRLASNLILTRLLVPEAFGLMVIVNVVIHGIHMFSDMGIGPSIIQNPKGEQPNFLRTAWTLQILRSIMLYAIAVLLAYPISLWYGEPLLVYVLPVVALNIIIDSFCSTQVGVHQRHLQLGKLMAIELGAYGLTVVVMVAGAFVSQSVWPLVAGSLAGSTVATVLTHTWLGGIRMRFQLDREVLRETYRFGRWIFFSSILSFFTGQLDRIVLAKFMPLAELGMYSIALMLSQVMAQLVARISRTVLFPVFARSAELGDEALRAKTFRFRAALAAASMPPLWALILLAPELIGVLYDDRYLEAGWMLQFLGIGAILQCLFVPMETVLMASGNSFGHMNLQGVKLVSMIGAMGLGGYYYSSTGIILGFVVANLVYYPALVWMVAPRRAWFPAFDAGVLFASAAALALGFYLKSLVMAAL